MGDYTYLTAQYDWLRQRFVDISVSQALDAIYLIAIDPKTGAEVQIGRHPITTGSFPKRGRDQPKITVLAVEHRMAVVDLSYAAVGGALVVSLDTAAVIGRISANVSNEYWSLAYMP